MVVGTRVAPEDEITPATGPEVHAVPLGQQHEGTRIAAFGKNQVHPAPVEGENAPTQSSSQQAGGAGRVTVRKNQVQPAPLDAPAHAVPSAVPTLPVQQSKPVAWEVAPHEKKLEASGEVYIPFRVAKSKVSEDLGEGSSE